MQVSYLFNQHDPSYKAVCALITKEIVKTSKLPNLVGLGDLILLLPFFPVTAWFCYSLKQSLEAYGLSDDPMFASLAAACLPAHDCLRLPRFHLFPDCAPQMHRPHLFQIV
ncbi:hypothetical protein [Eikenella corrodens]|uniref:hypothetical protein n=1 Tax=Eikenella corrodens TaxID=539 RepID=UPI0013E0E54E|nr:hypothetical protein [Eikenella corrodens]